MVEKTQVLYLEVVFVLIQQSVNIYNTKHIKKSLELLREVLRIGRFANDFNLLIKAHNLCGVILLNKREFIPAINEFKMCKDIAEEADIQKMRMHAFSMLGSCYQFMKEY